MADFAIPTSPQNVALRPLTKGMMSDFPGSQVPTGAGVRVENYYVEPRGLVRRQAWSPDMPLKDFKGQLEMKLFNERPQELIPFWKTDGSFQTLLLTNKRLYRMTSVDTTWQLVPYGNATYSIVSEDSGTNRYTFSGVDFVALGVRVGDLVQVTTAGGIVEVEIVQVVSATILQVSSLPAKTSSTVTITRIFTPDGKSIVDWTNLQSFTVFVDGSAGCIVKYDGSEMKTLGVKAAVGDPDPDYLTGARSCLYFNGYLFLGGTKEAGSDGSRFIRWSSVTDVTEFAVADYVFFNREVTPVLVLDAIEDIPVVYLETAIYGGYASDLVGLPYNFVKVEAGSISAVGPLAITGASNAAFFIGGDNVYVMTPGRAGTRQNLVVETIGDAIASRLIGRIKQREKARVLYDKGKEAIVFAIHTNPNSTAYEEIFYYFLKTKAWAYCTTGIAFISGLSIMPIVDLPSWSAFDSTTWSELDLTEWSRLVLTTGAARVVAIDTWGAPYAESASLIADSVVDSVTRNVVTIPYTSTFESGDMDFGDADNEKVVNRISLTTRDADITLRTGELCFAIELSEDAGQTWKALPSICLPAGSQRDETSGRFRADRVRLRVSAVDVERYILDDLALRLRAAGLHNVRG